MNKTLLLLASAAFATSGANAAVTGVLGGIYGPATAVVTYDAGAPESNFGAPTAFSKYIGYSIYLKAAQGKVYGLLQASGPGGSVGPFANVYFDIDPAGANGSDLGFELGANPANAFIPNNGSYTTAGLNIVTDISADGLTLEFAIPNSDFTSAIAGLDYDPGRSFASVGSFVTLRLSQSFGYSVAGGASYGTDRLGSVALAAVPEPASWALMIAGFGLVGAAMRRRGFVIA